MNTFAGVDVQEYEFGGLILPFWQVNPYRLISWCDVEKFSATAFYGIGKLLERLRAYHSGLQRTSDPAYTFGKAADPPLTEQEKSGILDFLSEVKEHCDVIGLSFSSKGIDRVIEAVSQGMTNKGFAMALSEIDQRIRDEMKTHLFMFIPISRAALYDKPELFGRDVNTKFPAIQFDVVEAGNCYAAGRGTAAVFHLMRIMEAGVQKLGNKLGVPLVDEKVWQAILDGINAKIKTLPPKDTKTVELSQATANLYAVKLAWRNEVMHPKETYTLEEAENLIRQVRIFMEQLARIVRE